MDHVSSINMRKNKSALISIFWYKVLFDVPDEGRASPSDASSLCLLDGSLLVPDSNAEFLLVHEFQ